MAGDQVRPIYVAFVNKWLFTKLIGALGINTIAAPSPGTDSIDEPYKLIAVIVAKIWSPSTILKGSEYRIVKGKVHYLSEIIND